MSAQPRIAVIGLGNMGTAHARDAAAYTGADLCAVVDSDGVRAQAVGSEHGVPWYDNVAALFENEAPHGVVIATPHPSHRALAEQAFCRGVHVLVEKPLAIDVADAIAIVEAYEAACAAHRDLRFAVMFQQRTYGHWKAIRDLVHGGGLGQLIRVTWIITDWFRTQAYYDSGGWRAKWRTEGGGVTMNQAPHNLDLYQWIVGRPERLTAIGGFGKYHTVEVEDEITIVAEHANGTVGHLISSTAESPGTNRLELVGERGKLVFEDGELRITETSESILEFIRSSAESFTHVPADTRVVPYEHHGEPGHRFIFENFADAIGDPAVTLIAEGREGVASLEIANGAIMSAWRRVPVELPLAPQQYRSFLTELQGSE